MTEPDDRPGSEDPEDPSELLRLIGRTVPRSPHADAHRATGDDAGGASGDDAVAVEGNDAPSASAGRERPAGPGPGVDEARDAPPDDRGTPLGPDAGSSVPSDGAATPAEDRGARSRPDEGVSVPLGAAEARAGVRGAPFRPGEGGSVPLDREKAPVEDRGARSGPAEGGFMPPDGAAGRGDERAVLSGHAAEGILETAEPVAHDDPAATAPAGAGEPAAEDAEAAAPADPAEAVDPAEAADPAEDEDEDEAGELDEQTDPLDDLADDAELELALEALLLVVDSPIDEPSLAGALNQTPSRVRQTLNRMSLAYTADRRGIDLRRVGEGWRFYTRDRYAPYVEKLLLDGQRARLTRAALETLAVVAYRQPVTRARVSAVRGVNCDGVLRTLFTRGLVEEAGTEEQTGGTLFRTTELFLERLGLSSVQELPPLAPLLPDIDAIDDLDGQR